MSIPKKVMEDILMGVLAMYNMGDSKAYCERQTIITLVACGGVVLCHNNPQMSGENMVTEVRCYGVVFTHTHTKPIELEETVTS